MQFTLCNFIVLVAIVANPCQCATIDAHAVERNLFAADIFDAVAVDKLNDNVLISPAAMQISLALAFYGAKDKTASEMLAGLHFGFSDPEAVVQHFSEFQKSFMCRDHLPLSTNIYINEKLEFHNKFKEIAKQNFNASVEGAEFHPPYNKRTAERINQVMQLNTNKKIGNVIQPEQLNDHTESIIVNAISLVAPWQKSFTVSKTHKRTFYGSRAENFEIDMMWTQNDFRYGEFSSLNAKIVELPYLKPEYAMLIILPNQMNGLPELETNLKWKNWLAFVDLGLSVQRVEILLPKFSVNFNIDLQESLKKLGVTSMFQRDGDFGHMYREFLNHYINSANFNAYLEISEAGVEEPAVELPASSGLKSFLHISRDKKVEAIHPFVFAVRHKDSIIFMGHIANNAFA